MFRNISLSEESLKLHGIHKILKYNFVNEGNNKFD